MPTAIYVERDPSYLLVRRRMVGTMTRAEWDSPALFQAALDRWWALAKRAIRVEDEEFVTEQPVTVYRQPGTGRVVFADIRMERRGPPSLITPDGRPLASWPAEPSGQGWLHHNTSYAAWAEGPLPHTEPDMGPALTPLDDPEVQAVRSQNRALRDLIDGALSPTNYAQAARERPTTENIVDFRIRGIFRRRDYKVLRSLQDEALGSKVVTSDGIIE